MTLKLLEHDAHHPGFFILPDGASWPVGVRETPDTPLDHADKPVPWLEIVRDPTDWDSAVEGLRRAHDELERQLRERTAALAATNARLQAEISERRLLETRLLEVSEFEQRRIGQDLHDGICQNLTGLAYRCSATYRKLADAVPEEAHDLERTVELIQQTLAQAHHLAHGLFPVRPHADGLMEALSQLVSDFQDMYPAAIRFVCETPVQVHDDAVCTHLYRIAQEALSNALKHGQPSEVTIELSADTRACRLCIRDNGRGLAGCPASSSGLGMETMRFRARAIDAQLDIQPGERGGLEVIVTVPHGKNSTKNIR